MKAVLAATSGKKKLYYVIDADSSESDGIVVNEENKAVTVSFFSFAMKMKNLKRFSRTPFHKFLWEMPNGEMKQIWIDTFITKNRPLNRRFTENLVIHTQLGEKANKQKKTEIKIKSFLDKATSNNKYNKILSTIDTESKEP
jgi:hypothetical protein